MKRLALFAIIAVLIAAGILFAIRRAAPGSHAAVAALLPQQTIALVHLPDFNRTRDQWHHSDIYQLYREPAVQDFLQKPLAQIPKSDTNAQMLRDIEHLKVSDGFVALISIENNNPVLLAGFRFGQSQSEADKIIRQWRERFGGNSASHQTIDYEQHKIEIAGQGVNLVATVYDKDWFFAANDVNQLKGLLDRADGRGKGATLGQDENFRAAMARMPRSYAGCFYLQPKVFADKLSSLRAQASSNESPSMAEQIHSLCGALRFDGGKMRDIWFIGMSKQEKGGELARSAAAMGTADTFLYLATILNVEKINQLNPPGSTDPAAAWLAKVFRVASRNGLTAADWEAAFNLELGVLSDWPASAHWPSAIATLPVKDPARASRMVNALTTAIDEDGIWTKTEKGGVQYFTLRIPEQWLTLTPALALSNKLLVVGLDLASVESAIDRSQAGGPGLAQSPSYKSAARALPEPSNFFAYIDLPLLYGKLDASLRPMLLMAAMFMPAISENVDLNKLPPPEIVTKHLSPIISSQHYDHDGYVAESVGPVTLSQATIGVVVPALFWWKNFHPSH